MLYMVVEHFKPGAAAEIYRRFGKRGRMQPDGLEYVSSWVATDFTLCFQLMRTDDEALLREWAGRWEDLMDFEFHLVRTSADAVAAISSRLQP